MTTPLRVDGADVSHHQGSLDLVKAKANGLRFLYHKATEGNTFKDAEYAERRAAAKKAGVPFGAYHFARFTTVADAVAEAKFFLSVAKPAPGDLLPALDFETGDQTRAERTALVGAFVGEVKRQLGRLPVVYTAFDLDKNFGTLLWQPRYNNSNIPPEVAKPWQRINIWQFSNGVFGSPNSHPGLGHVDLNTLRGDTTVGDFRIPRETTETGVFRVVSQNVKSLPLMPQDDVVEDVLLTASQAGIVGWQEIGPERYEAVVLSLASKGWDTFFAPEPSADPISWRKPYWELIDSGSELLHEASDFTKERRIVWVVLQHRKTGAKVRVSNRHYIANAWSSKYSGAAKRARQAVWNKGNARDKVFLFQGEYADLPQIAVGDMNSQLRRYLTYGSAAPNGTKVRYAVTQASIDQIVLINGADWKVNIDDADGELLLGRNSDHQGRRAKVSLESR